MAGVHNRLELDWLIKWTRDPKALIDAGDEYANKIFNEYFQIQMTPGDLTDEEIVSVYAYIKSQSEPDGGGDGEAPESEEAASGDASADAGGGADDAVVAQGETLFQQNCVVCHAVNEKVIGPALRDVHKRRDDAWIKSFITNSQKVIGSGDDYAVKLFEEYNKTLMPPHDFFSDDELTAIIEYIKAESAKPIPGKEADAGTGDVAAAEETGVSGFASASFPGSTVSGDGPGVWGASINH